MVDERDLFKLGFDEIEIFRSLEPKMCRACEGDLNLGDRVRVRETDDPDKNGLHHEECADEIVIEEMSNE